MAVKRQAAAKVLTTLAAKGTPIVYIHGIGAKPPPFELKLQWDLALFGRDMEDVTRMAYWADILHGATEQQRVGTRGIEGNEIDTATLIESVGVDPEREDAQELATGLLRTIGVTDVGRRTRVLPLPAFLRKPIARLFLKALVQDSAAYFFRPDVRKRIQKRFLDALPPPEQPYVVVAHSQGTVISLEVLANLAKSSKPPQVEQFLTLGSPLGVREVQDVLSCELKVPKIVRRWHNFADLLDPVALDKGIAGDFDGGGIIVDELIVNTEVRQLDGFNPHSASGYLAHPKVRRVVQESARVDIQARFLMARDVAQTLGAPERHPVLIEILEPGYGALGESEKETRTRESSEAQLDLGSRIENAAAQIEKIVESQAAAIAPEHAASELDAASVDRLRRFVSARLTPAELTAVANQHQDLRVYAIWKSTRKRKLAHRPACAVQADAAWASYAAYGKNIRWAVLDTGVRRDHPHFKLHNNIVEVWDCTRRGKPVRCPGDVDHDGHGTHVSGIIAGEAPNTLSGYLPESFPRGIAPMAELVVYKVLDNRGNGEDAWIIKALDHIAQQNENNSNILIEGINLSLGGPYDSTVYGCGFSPICAELRRLWRSGVLVVVAAGNEGQLEVTTPNGEVDLNTSLSIGDPANLEDCIAVGSINADRPHLYGVSAFSSRGPTADGRLKPDVVAPGERIRSCDSRYRHQSIGDMYRYESGTSMAAPTVSGLLAAFLSVRREFRGRPDEVKSLLLRTCIDLGRDRYHQGHGMPNLMRMLLEA